MHYAYPPRKSSNPPPFRPKSSRIPTIRRRRLKTLLLLGLGVLAALYLLSKIFGSWTSQRTRREPSGDPPVVLVTVLNEAVYGKAHSESIRENRRQYAERHGYEAMVVNAADYDLGGSPPSWARVVAMRHAVTNFPECRYLWFLEQNAFIMDPGPSLEEKLMNDRTLDELMIRNLPVVPPESIIKTVPNLKGGDVDFVLTQDNQGLSTGSFVVRNGDWAKFFLETWFDPTYRSYNFQRAETHALEHIVQWHPTVLSRMAIVPMRTMNSHHQFDDKTVQYEQGDFVVRAEGCSEGTAHSCEDQLASYKASWEKAFSDA